MKHFVSFAGSWKSVRFALAFALLFAVGSFGFYACTKKDVASEEVKPKKVARGNKNGSKDPYTIYGQMHNDALTHMKNNVQLPTGYFTTEQKVDFIKNEINAFAASNYSMTASESQTFTSSLNDYKNFVLPSTFISGVSYEDAQQKLREVKDYQIIDETEYQLMTRLLLLSKQGMERTISRTSFNNTLDSIKTAYRNQNYPSDMSRGFLAGVVISIADASNNWWENNTTLDPQSKSSAASKDAAGAILGLIGGGTVQAIGIAAGVMKFNPVGLALTVGVGAIAASVGALDWIQSWW